MASERFTMIFDVVDKSLKIIIDNDTGYYNITKIIKHIENNGSEVTSDFKLAGIPASLKNTRNKINDYFRLKSTKELIKVIKSEYNFKTDDNDNLTYTLNIEKAYSGTYIHKVLFDHVLSWINKNYAIKISKILDECRNEYNLKLKYENKQKDNKIQEQSNKIDELIIEVKDIKSINLKQSAELSKQSEEINKLLNYGKTANENIEEMQTSIDDMTNTVASALRDRNVRPDDDKHVQRFMLVKLNKYEYKIHTGTISHLRNVINNYTKDKKVEPKKYRNTKIIIQPIYNPNPSSLKKRLFKKINDYIKNELILLNTNIEPSVLYENVFTNRSNIIIDDDYNFNLYKLLTIIIETHNNRLDDDILDLSLNDNNDIDYNYQIKTYTI